MTDPLPGLIAFVTLLLLDAFLAASQAALTNARRHLLRERAERGDRAARLANAVAEDSTRVLATFQLAALLTHFLLGALLVSLLLAPMPALLAQLGPFLDPVASALIYALGVLLAAILVYVLAELIPATLAQSHAEAWAVALAAPARVVIAIFWPLAQLMSRLRRAIAAPRPGSPDGALVTEEEIMTLVDAGEEEGAIEAEEKEMIYSIFQLDETVVREIMLPRIDVVALDIGTPLAEAITRIHEAGHSRLPVYEETLDHIVGLLYAKDMINLTDQDIKARSLRSLMRPAYYVPETKKVLDLLRELQKAKVHMAVVIDEYGGTAGLVTIEDIVEEIVGEIRDEYDLAEEAPYEKVGADHYLVDARMTLDDLNHLLGVNLPSEEADTLGGFIYEQLGKVPEPGESIRTDLLTLEVMSVNNKRIGKVRVRRSKLPSDSSMPQNGNPHATA